LLRVLISSGTFPLRIDDGLPRFVYDLAEALAPHCAVTALVPDAPGAARRERMGGVAVRRFTYVRPRSFQSLAYGDGMGDNLRASLLARLQVPSYVWCQARATRRLAGEEGVDIVNSHWMIPQGLSSALARGPSAAFRHVVTLHGGDIYMLRNLPFGRALARFILGRTDFVFAVSSNVRDRLDELLGSASGAVLQPVGVRVGMFRGDQGIEPVTPSFDNGYLLFVGRLNAIKGVEYLLRAMPKILERHPRLGLVLLGYGPMEQQLRREVRQLGIDSAVEVVGRRPHGEVARYVRGCRAVVVPSIVEEDGRAEGMPTVVIEAMACGARVVGSAAGGIPDVIRHGENGWLCRHRDPDDLAAKTLLALGDPPDSSTVRRARETAARFDWPEVASRYLEAFESVVGRRA
jgi:glycosyltransferase involved in cell wall biosynthesis